jgi:hypothetical protein
VLALSLSGENELSQSVEQTPYEKFLRESIEGEKTRLEQLTKDLEKANRLKRVMLKRQLDEINQNIQLLSADLEKYEQGLSWLREPTHERDEKAEHLGPVDITAITGPKPATPSAVPKPATAVGAKPPVPPLAGAKPATPQAIGRPIVSQPLATSRAASSPAGQPTTPSVQTGQPSQPAAQEVKPQPKPLPAKSEEEKSQDEQDSATSETDASS